MTEQTYTAEQIDACILAYRSGDLNYCRAGIIDLLTCYARMMREPIPMVLFCPKCGAQHVDAADTDSTVYADGHESRWENPPHRSHLCHACGCIWRPADVPTTGVANTETRGKADNFDVNAKREPVEVTDDAFENWWHQMMHESFDFGPHEERYTDVDEYLAKLAWNAAIESFAASLSTGKNVPDAVIAYAWRKEGMNGWALGHNPPTPNMIDFDKYEIRPLYFAARPTAVPDGWKLVPIEPSDTMAYAALNDNECSRPEDSEVECMKQAYRAMLAAAPEVTK